MNVNSRNVEPDIGILRLLSEFIGANTIQPR